MEIGTDVDNFIDEEFQNEQTIDSDISDINIDDHQDTTEDSEDFITQLLRERGIDDKSRIKFENEEGIEEEVNWDNLSNQDKYNIINSSSEDPETDLDESEIQLINAIRSNNMTPQEYLQYVQQDGINKFVYNNNQPEYNFSTDQYSDDELFVMDFIARMGDVTDEEAQEALERAKSNETLYAKQIGAIRNEYKRQESEMNQQAYLQQEQLAQEQYNQFAQSVVDQINDFTEFSGYDLNLENDDMQQLYDFITGVDAAGNNHFAKALADPRVLVRTAYLALNGQQMIEDITDYFQREITQVRRDSYNKGKADALKMNNTNVVFKNNSNKSSDFYDIDDF